MSQERDLLHALLALRKEAASGVVEVRVEDATTRIYLDRGELVFADDGDAALAAREGLSEAMLAALADDVHQRILRCLLADRPEWELIDSAKRLQGVPRTPTPLEPLVLAAAREFDEGRILDLLRPGGDRFPVLLGDPASVAATFQMTSEERAFLFLLDGSHSMMALVVMQAAGVRVAPLLAALLLTEILAVGQSVLVKTAKPALPAVPRPRPPPPPAPVPARAPPEHPPEVHEALTIPVGPPPPEASPTGALVEEVRAPSPTPAPVTTPVEGPVRIPQPSEPPVVIPLRSRRAPLAAAVLAFIVGALGVVCVRTSATSPAAPVTSPAARPEARSAPVPPPPPAAESPSPAATTGLLRLSASAAGHRIFVDEKLVGQAPIELEVSCGRHSVRVGSQGRARRVDVPCGGDVTTP